MKTEILVAILLATLGFTSFSWGDEEQKEPVAEQSQEQERSEEVLITSDGKTLSITVDEEGDEGEQIDIKIDLESGISGAVAQKIIKHLQESGIIEGDSFELTADDLEALDDHELNIDIEADGDDGLIPIIAILSVFGTPVLIVYFVVRASTRRREMFHETVCKLAESGKDLPEGLIERLEGGEGGNAQQKAAKLIALGVAISISLFLLSGIEMASLGLIPLCIGMAQLWVWRTQQNQAAK